MSGKDICLPPLRGINDFLLGQARFQLPNYNDVDRWGNRVVNNILYYQTNYFFLTLSMFLFVGLIHPTKMLLGSCGISMAFTIYLILAQCRRVIEFKRKYPWVGLAGIILGTYFIVYMLDSVMVFLLGIVLPIFFVFLHSSLRLRNVRNKISNKMEMIGLMRSPMGKFLELVALRAHYPGNHGAGEAYKKSLNH